MNATLHASPLAAWHSAREAWRALRARHWAIALGAGLAFGIWHPLHYTMSVVLQEGVAPTVFLGLALMYLPTYVVASVLMLPGLAALGRRDAPATAYAGLIAAVGVVAGGGVGWASHTLSDVASVAFGWPNPCRMCAAFSASGLVLFALSRSLYLMIALALATLVYLYLRRSLRSAARLAAAQRRCARAEQRAVAEQLSGAQAMVEPAFLFDTLRLAERLAQDDVDVAQRVLTCLIAYLRAALPPGASGASTVGQQAELVRARLEIERMRPQGGFEFRVDVAPGVAERPFAPLLLAPLVANAVRRVEAMGAVSVQASVDGRGLVVEVSDNGAADDSGGALAAVHDRLARLYGDGARLVLAQRSPRGLCARLELGLGATG